MTPGSVFFDTEFQFHDGETGEKLFVVLGNDTSVIVVAKTTLQQHGRGTVFGCQPRDRLHNFYIPTRALYFKKCTWVCLNEFYEYNARVALQKRMRGIINPVCTIPPPHIRALQDCALLSDDITVAQHAAVSACLV